MSEMENSSRFLDLISELCGGVVTEFAVVAGYIDEDGERRIWTSTLDDQRCHTTMGLLSFALAVEQGVAQDQFHNGED